MSELLPTVSRRLEVVRSRIAGAGGDPAGIRIVAVTKGFGPEAVAAALAAGLEDCGENYAGELLAKAQAIASGAAGIPAVRGPAPTWHFLGQIQRNKVGRLAAIVSCWQSVDRIEEGRSIARAAPGAPVLVEVGTGGGDGRGGIPPAEVPGLVAELVELGLTVRGCMTVAPADPAGAAEAFSAVRRLVDDLGLEEASMGMSDDLELAVRHGSTSVRVGRALFGERRAR